MKNHFKSLIGSLRLGLHRLLARKATTLDGMVLTCDPAMVPRNVSTALIKGSYETPERQLVQKTLRHGHRVLEIGTGVGVVGILCNRLVGIGNVLSYEANATLALVIAQNYALNGLTPRLRLKAISRDGGVISFFRNGNIVSSSVFDRGLSAQTVSVESDPLGRIIAEEQATVLVMDVEGAEIALLRDLNPVSLREIIVELHPHIVGKDVIQSMIASICSKGFRETGRIHKNIRLSRYLEA